MQHGRAFACVVIAHSHQHTAMWRRACHIRMAHHITRTVHPRALAVPKAENAIIAPLAPKLGLLRSPQRRGRKVFIQAFLKGDIGLFQPFAGAGHLHVDRT